ncbi:MAG TPA: Uma2 family endonuclease [Tepidisphaeraceae bacterium]|nr:Uma2 family endonuclease [Tepidisphaeraceae bacterium]
MTQPVERRRHYTVEEYLQLESQSDEKFEYWDGFIVRLSELIGMAGGSYEHSIISANVIIALGNALQGGPCRVANSDLRVKRPRTPFYFHPDATVICGEAQLEHHSKNAPSLLNPRVVVEVLSPSTEAYDRGGKLRQYLEIPSLHEYVLVLQDTPRVESFWRRPDGSCSFNAAEGLEANLLLCSLDVSIPLRQIYENITFPPPEPPAGAGQVA